MIQKRQSTFHRISRIFVYLLFLIPIALQAQTNQITGVVTDATTGEPLIGVSVQEKGTTNGTITNLDGEFMLNVPLNSLVTFSYVGYNTQDVRVTSGTLTIRMEESNLNLEEVVVVGYGVQKKINLTGAVTSVKSDDLLKANAANSTNALIGQMPGLIAKQPSGEPGNDNSNIYIRGIATFQGGTEPTYIIDGIERTKDDFARIDANEIESVNVLKDAASAAIFGMRGANGVIVVTTKRGKAAKASIRYSGNISVQSPVSLPKFANSYDYARLYNDFMGTTVYTDEEIQKFRDGSDPLRYPNTDWYDLMLSQNAIQTQHNLSVNGGSEDLSYFVSLGYMDQGGLWENLGYERYNLRSNLDAKITSTTKLSVDISGRVENTNGGSQGSTGIFQQMVRNTPVLLAKFPDGRFAVPDATHPNILALADPQSGYNRRRNFAVLSRVELAQDLSMFTEGLMVRGIMSYDYTTYKGKSWSTSPYLYELNGDEYELKERSSPSLSLTNSDRKAEEYQAQLTYDRGFGPHNVSALLMAMAHKEKHNELYGSRNSFDSEVLDQLNAGNTTGQSLSGHDYRTARISYVGRVNYNYMQRYLAEVNLRRDGSENFAPDKRWGTFTSFSLGWVISEEAFFENLKSKINYLKIRGSYGTLGNDNTGGVSFPYYSRFDLYSTNDNNQSSGFGYNMGDYVFGELVTKGMVPGAIANKLATWEKSKKSNIAIDFGLYNRFTMSVDLFLENRTDILAQRSAEVPGSFGGILPLENIGKVRNKGIDLMATYSDRIGDVQYSIGGNFTFARNKILEMAEAAGTSNLMSKTGRPIGGLYGYKTDGIFKTQAEIDNYAKQEVAGEGYVTQPGDIKYVDVNGDNVVNADDMTYLGIGNIPEIVYGINGSVSWKRFDLSFLFQGAARTQVYLNGGIIIPYFNQGNLQQLWVNDSWSESNMNARYPRLVNSTHNFPTLDVPGVETYVYDASYFRLKNIEIGYNLPKTILSRVGIEAIRIYASGQNLFTIDNIPQIDPENTHSQGWTYPQMKSFNFGINLQF